MPALSGPRRAGRNSAGQQRERASGDIAAQCPYPSAVRRGLFIEIETNKFSSSVATVLIGKLEIIVFKEAIHEDNEFAHTSGHGDERLLSGGAQAQIQGAACPCGRPPRCRSHGA